MPEHNRTCWYCGGDLIWDSDYNYDEVFGDGSGEGSVTYLHCTKCGAEIQYVLKDE